MDISVTTIDDYFELITKFRKVFTANVETLQDLAQDESQPFVLRTVINMMVSDDEATALKGISFIHEMATSAANIQYKEDVAGKITTVGPYQLSDQQNKIYKKLKVQIDSDKVGDDYLIALLSVNIDRLNVCNAILSHSGVKMEYKTGAQQVRPEVTVARESSDNIQKILKSLGITSEGKAAAVVEKPKEIKSIMKLVNKAK